MAQSRSIGETLKENKRNSGVEKYDTWIKKLWEGVEQIKESVNLNTGDLN